VFVSRVAKVMTGKKLLILSENESTYIPVGLIYVLILRDLRIYRVRHGRLSDEPT
jgi:hypothetical protein